MARIAGRLAAIQVSTDGGVTYTTVGGLADGTLNLSQAELKTTAHDDGAFEAYIAGRKDGTVDMKMRYDEGDAAQTTITTSFYNGTVLAYSFAMQGISPASGYKIAKANGIVTKLTPAGSNDDVASYDMTIRLTGTITWTAQ